MQADLRSRSYRWPLLLAIAFHLLLIFLLLTNFNSVNELPSLGNPKSVIHANLINDQQLARMMKSTQLPKPLEPSVSKPAPKPVQQPMSKPVTIKQPTTQPKPLPTLPNPQPNIKQATKSPSSVQPQTPMIAQQKQAQQQAVNADKQQALRQLLQQADANDASQQLNQLKTTNTNPAPNNTAQASAQQSLQQMQAEGQQMSNQTSQTNNAAIAKYTALILNAIEQNWLIPDNSNPNLSATLLIQVAPGGVVLNVQLITSSGNPALDRSAIAAVYKSSPLPVPSDATLFNSFRELRLVVRPENVINS